MSARFGSEMIALGAGQGFIADEGQGGAAARILDAGPGQGRIEIVAAVHEYRAGLDLVADLLCRLGIIGPDRGGESIERVVHELDGFLIIAHLHDADDWSE